MYNRINFVIVGLIFVISNVTADQIFGSVSCTEKRIIIDRHNELRKEIAQGKLNGQPMASNMQKLVWDDQLENTAQNWANKAKQEHNTNVKDDRFLVGENLHFSYSSYPGNEANWTFAIDDWFNEHSMYKYSTNFHPQTGHYTQVVWADTKYVGCGFSYHKKNGLTHKLYVCNYGPRGNFIGQHPYNIGEGCEELCCEEQCGKLYGDEC